MHPRIHTGYPGVVDAIAVAIAYDGAVLSIIDDAMTVAIQAAGLMEAAS